MDAWVWAGKDNPIREMGYGLYNREIVVTEIGGKTVLAMKCVSEKVLALHVGNDFDGVIQLYVDKPNCHIRVNDQEV